MGTLYKYKIRDLLHGEYSYLPGAADLVIFFDILEELNDKLFAVYQKYDEDSIFGGYDNDTQQRINDEQHQIRLNYFTTLGNIAINLANNVKHSQSALSVCKLVMYGLRKELEYHINHSSTGDESIDMLTTLHIDELMINEAFRRYFMVGYDQLDRWLDEKQQCEECERFEASYNEYAEPVDYDSMDFDDFDNYEMDSD